MGIQVRFLAAILLGLSLAPIIGSAPAISAEEKGAVFSTWEGFEADKCASIWLIKRFVSPGAVIRFFPRGEPIAEGIPFDTPDATLRRHHNASTFETILKGYDLHDPRLTRLGEIIHDIEINVWERKRFEETLAVREAVNAIIQSADSPEEVMERSMVYFDSLFKTLPPGPGG